MSETFTAQIPRAFDIAGIERGGVMSVLVRAE
jgi:hypothetical protein